MDAGIVQGVMTGRRLGRRNHLDRSCLDKKRHVSRQAGEAVIRIMGTDGRLETYSCQFCGGWHIGHGE